MTTNLLFNFWIRKISGEKEALCNAGGAFWFGQRATCPLSRPPVRRPPKLYPQTPAMDRNGVATRN